MSGWLWVGIVGEWVGTCVDGYVCRVRVCGWVNEWWLWVGIVGEWVGTCVDGYV